MSAGKPEQGRCPLIIRICNVSITIACLILRRRHVTMNTVRLLACGFLCLLSRAPVLSAQTWVTEFPGKAVYERVG